MRANPSLAELAALQGDKSPLPPQKPLSEAAYAELVEAMRLLNAASKRVDAAQGALQHCRVSFDVQAFRRLQSDFDAAWAGLQPAMLAHLDALDAAQKGRAP